MLVDMSSRDLDFPHRGLQTIPFAGGELRAERLEVNRLVVLVPTEGLDGNELARQIWSLAEDCELQVLLLSTLSVDAQAGSESVVRLRLATTYCPTIPNANNGPLWEMMRGERADPREPSPMAALQ